MIVVDTNVLVRYIMRDDSEQAKIAQEFLAQHECLVLRTVVLELVWVLVAGYKLSKETVVEYVRHILCLPNISTEDVDNVLLALQWYWRYNGMNKVWTLPMRYTLPLAL